MATINSFSYTSSLNSELRKSLDNRDVRDPVSTTHTLSLASGSGAESGNMVWHDQRTVATGANDDIDLSGGITDAFGDSITFTKIRYIEIKNESTNDTLTIGGAANPVANVSGTVQKSGSNYPGIFVMTAPDASGLAVTAGSADELRITHDGDTSNSVTYEITIAGEE